MPDNEIRAVIFDLDGTLLNTLPDIAHSINSALEKHGFPTHPDEAYRLIVGWGIQVTVQRAIQLGVGDTAVEEEVIDLVVRDVNDAYLSAPAARTDFYDGIEDVLDTATERGMPMAILSNKPDLLVQPIAAKLLGKWNFMRILGQREGVPKKPDPAVALELADQMSTEPAKVLFLGDSDIDIMTALGAGMFAAGAAWGFRDAGELWGAGAMAVAEHPSEVVGLIRGQ